MRILAVHNHYKIPGGEDSVFSNECSLLREKGNRVFEYTRHNKDLKAADLIFTAPFSKKTYREVRELIRSEKIDILHLHNDRYLITPAVFMAAKDEGIPVVQTLHNFRLLCINAMLSRNGSVCRECVKNGNITFKPAIAHKCFRNSRLLTLLNLRVNKNAFDKGIYDGVYFITLTDFNKELFTEAGFDESRIFVKPNFTDEFKNAPAEEKVREGFIYLGRIDPLKGIEDILNEWKNVPEDIILSIAGSGENEYVEDLKRRFPLKNVRFLGGLGKKEAMELLSSSKAMIFASRWYEGFPMTIIESFACGTPVIGKQFGNGGDIIAKIYGKPDPLISDMSLLRDRIVNFDRDRLSGLYDVDRERLEIYTPDRNYEILMGIYENILSGKEEING